MKLKEWESKGNILKFIGHDRVIKAWIECLTVLFLLMISPAKSSITTCFLKFTSFWIVMDGFQRLSRTLRLIGSSPVLDQWGFSGLVWILLSIHFRSRNISIWIVSWTSLISLTSSILNSNSTSIFSSSFTGGSRVWPGPAFDTIGGTHQVLGMWGRAGWGRRQKNQEACDQHNMVNIVEQNS